MSIFSRSQLVDALGNVIGQLFTNPLCAISKSYEHAVSEGSITNAERFAARGRMTNVSVNTAGDDLWEGTALHIPIPPTTGEQLTVFSTSTSDAAAGVGAQTVQIEYLDTSGVERLEVVTLNGTTHVNTVATNIRFVNDVVVLSAGSSQSAVGNVSVASATTPTNIYAMIAAGNTISTTTHAMVPAGKTLYIKRWTVGSGASSAIEFCLRATTDHGVVLPLFIELDSMVMRTGVISTVDFAVPIKVPALSIVKITCYVTTAASGLVTGSWEGWVE